MESRQTQKTIILYPAILAMILFWSAVSFCPNLSAAQERRPLEPLLQLLPLESDLTGWELDGEPQAADGIRLFELINGGAEEYVKAGFRRAVLATYRNRDGKRINLEIYEMLSPESAGIIHRRKAGDGGREISVGEEASMGDYYLNFRKGAYQITLSGDDNQRETLECLLRMARWIAEKIGTFSQY